MAAPTVMQWVQHLETKIEEQRQYAKPFEVRYDNQHVLPFIAAEYREVYGARVDSVLHTLIEAPRAGAAAVTVDALVERLTVLGGTSDDPAVARALAQAWEDNDLDVMHREAHREALIRRNSFGFVSRSTDARAVFTVESSEQCAVHRMKAPPYDVDAFFKVTTDEWTGEQTALLQLYGRDIHLAHGQSVEPDPEGSDASSRWRVVDEKARRGPVPVVEFNHQPRLLRPPASEIEPITTLVDEVDLIEGLMVFAGHFGAVPIRYGIGVEIPRDPKDPSKPLLGPDGKPVIGFKPRADHFWFNSSKDASFGQLVPATLDGFVTWATHAKTNLRAKTKVASTYYAIDLKSHMTAELLKTDEAPMVRRVNSIGQHGSFNHSWRRGQTIMMQFEGYDNARVRPLWEDPQTRIEAQAVDAFQKAVASGLGVVTAAEEFLGWPRELAEKAVEEAREEARQADPFELLDPATRAGLKLLPGGSGNGSGNSGGGTGSAASA